VCACVVPSRFNVISIYKGSMPLYLVSVFFRQLWAETTMSDHEGGSFQRWTYCILAIRFKFKYVPMLNDIEVKSQL